MFPTVLKPFIWIDYGIFALISVTLLIGTMRGFSREIVSLLCWVIGIWTSLYFSISISSLLQIFIPVPKQTLCRYFYWLISTNPFSRQFVAAIFHHPFQANLQAHRFYGAIRWLLCRYYARCRHHNHYRFSRWINYRTKSKLVAGIQFITHFSNSCHLVK